MKILIATSRFRDLAGSEITALELAEALRANACDVTIASFEMGGVLQAGAEASGIRVVQLTPNAVLDKVWDLVWVFHPVTYYMLFATLQVQGMTVIYSSWSHFEPLESPPVILHPVDLYTVNSLEHLSFFSKEYPALSTQAVVLPNSVPSLFFECQPRDAIPDISRIALVSNHPPQEVLDAATYLRAEGGTVDIFGNDGVMKLVTPQLLLDYDAVVTIGKTVPYCLALQIPVFCYDHFGGPGWITAENVDVAAEYNFSGRCSRTRINALEIAKALGSACHPDLNARKELRVYACRSMDLRENIQYILDCAKGLASKRPRWSEENRINLANSTTANILSRHNQIFLRERQLSVELRKAWNETITKLLGEKENAKAQIEYRDSLVAELEQRLEAVEQNANAQIEYRDSLVSELEQRLKGAQTILGNRRALLRHIFRSITRSNLN